MENCSSSTRILGSGVSWRYRQLAMIIVYPSPTISLEGMDSPVVNSGRWIVRGEFGVDMSGGQAVLDRKSVV